MTSLYEISYYGIEQHIRLTLPAWFCLFTGRNDMTLFNTLALHSIRWCNGMSLASHGEGRWFETHPIPRSVSYVYCYHCLYVLLSFSRNRICSDFVMRGILCLTFKNRNGTTL